MPFQKLGFCYGLLAKAAIKFNDDETLANAIF